MLALSRFLLASTVVSTTLAAVFTIQVGEDGTTYTPNNITGAVDNDIISFTFHPKNHTVTQSSLATPCTPLQGGGNTGFVPVAAGTTSGFPVHNMTLPTGFTEANKPLWFHCEQTGHCSAGMVFAVNPTSDAQMNQFIANAKAQGTSTGTSTTSSASSVSTPPTGTTTTASQPTDGSTGTGTGTAPGATHSVTVGMNGTLTYMPDSVTAVQGDVVLFTFRNGSHTVTQASFEAPCVPLAGGVDSGPEPATGLSSGFPTFTYTVSNATAPIWIYCRTPNHCQQGMVMAINAPTSGNTLDAFRAAAEATTPSTTGSATGSPSSTPGSNDASARFVGGVSSLLLAGVVAVLLL